MKFVQCGSTTVWIYSGNRFVGRIRLDKVKMDYIALDAIPSVSIKGKGIQFYFDPDYDKWVIKQNR